MEIRHDDDAHRYELVSDGEVVSFTAYRDEGGRRVFPHTVTDPAHRGHGHAARVVRAALDDTRAAGQQVVPQCWFVAGFIDANPEYRDLVAG